MSTSQTHNQLPKSVRIVEVGPRDGLQNEQLSVPIETKVELINELVDCGLKTIEAGSFVNPRWVPQMAGSDEVFSQLQQHQNVTYAALTPNLIGLQRAIDVGVNEVAVFPAATETFSLKNLNCSIEKSLIRFTPVIERAREQQIQVRGSISCAFGCPYDGTPDLEQILEIAQQLFDLGCFEICLCDTIGVATADKISQLVNVISNHIPIEHIALHLHDTYGQAIANIYAGLTEGVSVFDTSIAGLGGCPYAKGATGNVATEDVAYLLNGLGIEHGIDLLQLAQTGAKISARLNRPYGAKAGLALLNRVENH